MSSNTSKGIGTGRITTVMITLMLFSMLMVVMPDMTENASAATTIYVAPSGGDYTSIREAVENASSGDTIDVAAGTYVETAQINVTVPLSIVGAGRDVCNVSVSGGVSYVFYCNCPWTNISKLNISTAKIGIRVAGNQHKIFNNSFFISGTAYGSDSIWVKDATNISINNNTFYSGFEGIIVLPNSFYVTIRENSFSNIEAMSMQIYYDAEDVTITNNTIEGTGNRYVGVIPTYGIYGGGAGGAPRLKVERNHISNHGVGIEIGHREAEINNNTIWNCNEGIRLNQLYISLGHNIIYDCVSGIKGNGKNLNILHNNTLYQNDIALDFSGGGSLSWVDDNKVFNNRLDAETSGLRNMNSFKRNSFYNNQKSNFLELTTNVSQQGNTEHAFNITYRTSYANLGTLDSIDELTVYPFAYSYSNDSSHIWGTIDADQYGVYSIFLNLSDNASNRFRHVQRHFSTNESMSFDAHVDYYYKDLRYHTMSLTFDTPTTEDRGWYTDWAYARFPPPIYPVGTIQDISVGMWTADTNYFGVEQIFTLDNAVDVRYDILPAPGGAFQYNSTTFTSLGWNMSSDSDWDDMVFKIVNNTPVRGGWCLGSLTQISHIGVDYIINAPVAITTFPIDYRILSATHKWNYITGLDLYLEGDGTHTIPLRMNDTLEREVQFDGVPLVEGVDYTREGRWYNVTVTLGSVHHIMIKETVEAKMSLIGPSPGTIHDIIEVTGEESIRVEYYNYSWGDGTYTNSTSATASHQYQDGGARTITLTVWNETIGRGDTDTASVEVLIPGSAEEAAYMVDLTTGMVSLAMVLMVLLMFTKIMLSFTQEGMEENLRKK